MYRNLDLIPLLRDERDRAIRASHLAAVAQCARRCCQPQGRLARLARGLRLTSTPIDC